MNLSSGLMSCLSGNDAITLLEFIHQSLSCESKEDFAGLVLGIQELLSCDYAIAALGHHDDVRGVVIEDGVNISFPEGWCVEYEARNYVRSDPLVKESFLTYTPQYWAEAKKRIADNEVQKKIVSLCMDFHMKDGYTIGLKPFSREKNGSIFCFSSPSMTHDKRTETILEHLLPHLHLAISHALSNKDTTNDKVALSSREKEVLNWLKDGKSSWDISTILRISESTVNYHVYNIMRKLNVVNRTQALAVAARMGLIDMA